jgi:hypothetical protein
MAMKFGMIGVCAAVVAAMALAVVSAEAQIPTPKKKRTVTTTTTTRVATGPRARVRVAPRSFLDPGTEVLPGDRKFTDYAFPSPYGFPSFAVQNVNRPIERQPLNEPVDLGGAPTKFPLY